MAGRAALRAEAQPLAPIGCMEQLSWAEARALRARTMRELVYILICWWVLCSKRVWCYAEEKRCVGRVLKAGWKMSLADDGRKRVSRMDEGNVLMDLLVAVSLGCHLRAYRRSGSLVLVKEKGIADDSR